MKPDFSPKNLRRTILDLAYHGQCAHLGCALSIVEILSVLYGQVMKYDPKNPNGSDRDYLILSKGHGVMALYACFKELGWVSEEEIKNYLKDGTRLHGLAEAHIPGIECNAGSLGHGLPVATGIAYGLKRRGSSSRVFVIVGDGELQEGSNWEAIQFAANRRLDNLTLIVDANGWQAMDRVNRWDHHSRLEGFGMRTTSAAGHNAEKLTNAMQEGISSSEPKAVIAFTEKGKGVSFAENDNSLHYKRLTPKLYQRAVAELG